MRREAITRTTTFAARVSVALAALVAAGCAGQKAEMTKPRAAVASFQFSQLPPVPDPHGFAGVYAGVSHGALIVTGGSNFQQAPPWKGGTKSWYSDAYVLPKGASTWQRINALLPTARGYGATITIADKLYCIGGADSTHHYADAFTLEWIDGKLIKADLPSLPITLGNIAGARIGTTIYITGGAESPTATSASARLFVLDTAASNLKWAELDPIPGPGRILPVAAAIDGSLFVASGASLAADAAGKPARTYLADAYRYTPGHGWSKLAMMPHAAVAAPSPAADIGDHRFAIFGGDTGADVNFEPKEKHPGFSHDVLAYDAAKNIWSVIAQLPLGQVTTTLVDTGDAFIVPNGEIRPATRTPLVTVVTPVFKDAK